MTLRQALQDIEGLYCSSVLYANADVLQFEFVRGERAARARSRFDAGEVALLVNQRVWTFESTRNEDIHRVSPTDQGVQTVIAELEYQKVERVSIFEDGTLRLDWGTCSLSVVTPAGDDTEPIWELMDGSSVFQVFRSGGRKGAATHIDSEPILPLVEI